MGNFESSMSNIMDNDHDSDSSEDIEIGYDMFNMYLDFDSNESDVVDANDDILNILLQRFINTDQFNFRATAGSRFRMPQIKAKPNLDTLKTNAVYQSIKYGSGFGSDGTSPVARWSLVDMINNRQNGMGAQNGAFTQPQRCKINNNYIPNYKKSLFSVEKKIFCGTFSRDGNHFVTASQDSVIRIHDSSTPQYKRVNEIAAKNINWCILDVAFSPNGQYFAYSTWSSSMYLSHIEGNSLQLASLSLLPTKPNFCIFSVAFSNCGQQIIGGGSDGGLYIYDLTANRNTYQVPVETDTIDVNAVGFVDDTSNIMYSGADNGRIKIWDRRTLSEGNAKEVGCFVGHLDGVTYIDSKNDSRYLISNSKDQTIKLWDMRAFSRTDATTPIRRQIRYNNRWDYRWDEVPTEFYTDTVKLPEDTSIMTYRGHRVKKTLIRAKFSPQETTGQRYIYTGCGTGRLIVYDVLTGKIINSNRAHKDIVRDVAWHPKRNEILTSSWDCRVCLHSYQLSKRSHLKRCLSQADCLPENKSNPNGDNQGPPPRRSRRLALRRQAQELN